MSTSNSRRGEEPPDPLCFLLGRDRGGHWVVREAHGLYSGWFGGENAAFRYANFESADRGAIFKVVTEPIEWSSAF